MTDLGYGYWLREKRKGAMDVIVYNFLFLVSFRFDLVYVACLDLIIPHDRWLSNTYIIL